MCLPENILNCNIKGIIFALIFFRTLRSPPALLSPAALQGCVLYPLVKELSLTLYRRRKSGNCCASHLVWKELARKGAVRPYQCL